ncbi:GAF domain-containing protein [Nocardia sp. NPDC006630]|uniref:GAF domain-containing protein n=1 Tax=Nocardia sp. NPDC006630 TaxID=3157181 RepID=UPI0033A618E5
MTWYFIEALANPPAPMTIINKDGAPREWTSLRSLHRHEGLDLDELLEEVRGSDSGAVVDRVVRARNGSERMVRIVPVLGPTGDVYGLHLWIGGLEEEPTPHRPAAGLCFHLETLAAQLTAQSWEMSNLPGEVAGAGTLSPAEMFRRVVRYDAIDELVTMGVTPDPDAVHDVLLTVLHNDGHLMQWQAAGRGRKDEKHTGMRGLNLDITDFQTPAISPLEALGITTDRPVDGPAAALLASTESVDRPVIAEWIGKTPAWIDWERENGDTQMFHPEDWDTIRATFQEIGPDEERTTACRIRAFTESGWQPITMISRRYPGEVGANLHVVRISKA